MSNKTQITLAFLNYNTATDLLKALESVNAAVDGVSARIVVIDNGSTDDSIARIKALEKDVEIIALPSNAGFAAAFNRIFSYIITPYYLLLNSDIILKPGSVKKMLDQFKDFPNAGLAGVALERENGSLQTSYGGYPTLASELINRSLWQKAKRMKLNKNLPFHVDCVVGAVMLVSHKTVSKIGGMDERFFFFLEETDWCKRINESGLKVIHLPDVKVVHLQGKTANKAPIRARIEFHKSRLLFFEKHYGKIAATILRYVTVFRIIINFTAQLLMTIFSLGLIKKTKLRTVLYAGLLKWYFSGCPIDKGLNRGCSKRVTQANSPFLKGE